MKERTKDMNRVRVRVKRKEGEELDVGGIQMKEVVREEREKKMVRIKTLKKEEKGMV